MVTTLVVPLSSKALSPCVTPEWPDMLFRGLFIASNPKIYLETLTVGETLRVYFHSGLKLISGFLFLVGSRT